MSIIIETPFQNFTGLDGKPLTNGEVYIGQVGTDPTVLANQIPVFWDETMTIPAFQPLETNAGYIVRSGTPARVWVATDYSMSVKNASGVLVYYISKFGVVDLSIYAKISDLISSSGASLIGWIQLGIGAVFRTVQSKLRDTVSVTDYGAKGDGVTNDTDSMQAAINYAISSKKALRVPAGTYIVSGLDYNTTSSQVSIIGDGSGVTIIRNTLNTSPALTIRGGANQINVSGINFSGNGSVRSWGSGNGSAGNALTGSLPTSECAVRMIDLVHANFKDCYFTDAVWGADIQGGIVITFTSCYAYWNGSVGYRVWKSASSGWPNVITLRDSHAIENGAVGVYFDDGRQIILDGCDIEGNGKNTIQANSLACGLYIGSNTGSEGGTTTGPNGGPFNTIAASISNCWFEQNGNNNGSGIPNAVNMAHIVHSHGAMKVSDSLFTNTTAGRGIRIDGGMYTIENSSFESSLTVPSNVIDEGATTGRASILTGNYINGCYGNSTTGDARLKLSQVTIDRTKTTIDFSESIVQSGSATTDVTGNLAVTFPIKFNSVPVVCAQGYINDNSTSMYSADVYNVTVDGFQLRTKKMTGGSPNGVGAAVLTMWIATGPKQ